MTPPWSLAVAFDDPECSLGTLFFLATALSMKRLEGISEIPFWIYVSVIWKRLFLANLVQNR